MAGRKDKIGTTILLILILLVGMGCTVSAKTTFSKSALKLKVTKVTSTAITLRATKRSGITEYRFYECNAKGKKRTLVKESTSNKITLKNVQQGKTYYFCVQGYATVNGKKAATAYSKVAEAAVPVPETVSTLKKLLQVGLQPVGSTLYVYGGGWNESDTGANAQTRSIGVSSEWEAFFNSQTKDYNYKLTYYQTTKGLDCSGYVGWCIYNILNTESGKSGYVMLAQKMAKNFASRGWGTYTASSKVHTHRAGDIMSLSAGHVYIVVGECPDGSVVLMHSSPPGVQLAGTAASNGTKNSQAVKLAKKYMKKYFSKYYSRYPGWKNYYKDKSYLTGYSRMRWDISGASVMSDPDGYSLMTADQILKDLFRSY